MSRTRGVEKCSDEAGEVCPVVAAAKVLGSVWSLVVIYYLIDGPKGFNELLRSIPGLSSKTLSRTLKALQAKGLVTRNVASLQPFSVRYSLTKAGSELKPVIEEMRRWGVRWGLNLPVPKTTTAHRPYRSP